MGSDGRRKIDDMIKKLELGGFIHFYTGKTRETFIHPLYPDLLYILATDRISIFDIVMNATIPSKGAILTAMTVHWLKNVFHDVPNHLVAYGSGILEYLPPQIGEVTDETTAHLMKNMLVTKRTKVLQGEAIIRGHLTGSGLKDYWATGMVCGIKLPPCLIDGSELPEPIFTPSTKAPYGLHDENISFEELVTIIGEEAAAYVRDTSLTIYRTAKNILRALGITLADTKFEFGIDSQGNPILIDEILTPDSSRFWPEKGREIAMREGKTPPSLDKQPIRIKGEAAGIKTSNPQWVPPEKLISETVTNYRHILKLVTGMSLEQFWQSEMGIE